jgi:class 3 adenylate cyclase/CHASE2 domain-containing sensor protein
VTRVGSGLLAGLAIPAVFVLLARVPYAGDTLGTLRHQAHDLFFFADHHVGRLIAPPRTDAKGREEYGAPFSRTEIAEDRTGDIASPTVIVAIDRQTLVPPDGPRRNMQSLRALHPVLLEKLAARKVHQVAFDIDFSTVGPDETALIEALRRSAVPVVLGCQVAHDYLLEKGPDRTDGDRSAQEPVPELWGATQLKGFFNHPPDRDGRVRRSLLAVPGRALPSIDLIVALAHLASDREPRFQVFADCVEFHHTSARIRVPRLMPIRFRDFPDTGRVVPIVSYEDVIRSASASAPIGDRHGNSVEWEGRTVLVGAMEPILHDDYLTPLCTQLVPLSGAGSARAAGGARLPLVSTRHRYGVEIHAYAINTIVAAAMDRRGRAFGEVGDVTSALVTFAVSLAVALAGTAMELRWALLAWMLLLAATGTLGLWLFTTEWLLLDLATPALSGATVAAITAYSEYRRQRAYRDRIRAGFEHFAPPHVVRMLENDPSFLDRPGQRRELTVLFADIRDFTTYSEAQRPEAVVDMLNVYFGRVVELVLAHGGRIDKFVGDAVMAVFGDPVASGSPAADAVRAALAMARAAGELRGDARFSGSFRIGIGINTGEMVVGHIGGKGKKEYTVIGDAVNVASRLEGLTKQHPLDVVISGETRSRLPADFPADLVPLGETTVKGRLQAIPVFGVRPRSPPPPPAAAPSA